MATFRICYVNVTPSPQKGLSEAVATGAPTFVPARYGGRFPPSPPSLPSAANVARRPGKMLRKSCRSGHFQMAAEKFRIFGFSILTKQRSSVMILHVAAVAKRLRQRLGEHSSAGRASALQAEGHRFEPCCSHHNGAVVQLVRMPACHAGGRGFEPLPGRHHALVAQSVEQQTENLRVGGSIPPQGTMCAVVAQW